MLPEILELTSAANANITVLFLRGVKTAFEIKQHTKRLQPFSTPSPLQSRSKKS